MNKNIEVPLPNKDKYPLINPHMDAKGEPLNPYESWAQDVISNYHNPYVSIKSSKWNSLGLAISPSQQAIDDCMVDIRSH